MSTVLFITPPFSQLNTPYPASPYLKGFLNTKNRTSTQVDLGIEVFLRLFSKQGLTEVFKKARQDSAPKTDNIKRIIALQDDYLKTIDPIVSFLQGKNPSVAHLVCQEDFLPEAARFSNLDELDWAFGSMGIQDKAKHLASLYIEDIFDLIVACVDVHFGLSRYAERLGRSADCFDQLYFGLQKELTYIDQLTIGLLDERIKALQPSLVAITVPFPGNLYSALRCGQWIKQHYPSIRVAMGGGFANTELRSVADARVFEFVDFITLDDGEAPLENLLEYLEGKRSINALKRTFTLSNELVSYYNQSECRDYKQTETGTPDYSDLPLDMYVSMIEVVNPMHRMWSDGRWNKLTMAHGCYWGKCSFCDVSLDYIKRYDPLSAKTICDRMEALMAQTGQNGFHFVDEAAPPALMRNLALEILRRKLVVTWWGNVRFEKYFTKDVCLLLKASGCIAVSGGLEVASDRLLQLINKGITVEQVAKVTRNLTEAGIMVHAYLMYGFPTQTAQETIDSLEMVRQMFQEGILQSAFWHQFAMTAHSTIGRNPAQFSVSRKDDQSGTFANNDVPHVDKTGAKHEQYSSGLKKSLYNFMHGLGFEQALQTWFDSKVPSTKIDPHHIAKIVRQDNDFFTPTTAKIVWLGNQVTSESFSGQRKGRTIESLRLTIHGKKTSTTIQTEKEEGEWLINMLSKTSVTVSTPPSFLELKADFEENGLGSFELFWYGKAISSLRKIGLLAI